MNYETKINRADEVTDGVDDVQAARRKRWLTIAAIFLVAIVLAGAFFLMHSSSNTNALVAGDNGKQAPRVTTIVPGRTTVQSTISVTGTLAARRDMPVGSVGEGGMVVRVLVEPGTWVKAGQVLAIVDRQVQAQQSNQLAAQISSAQAEARIAQADLERAQALQNRGFISKADLQRKEATRDSASARVRVTQAQFSENRARIGRLDIRAPASGLVLTRAVEPGQVVGANGTVLFRIAMGGELELKAAMAEADLVRMQVGMSAKVTPVGSERTFSGQIWQVAPVIDPQSRQGDVRIALPYDKGLRPGGFAAAEIVSGVADAPLLPETAVLSDARGSYVFVIDGQKKVQRRDIKVGSMTDKGAAIAAGLNGNEEVVLSAGGFLNPGEAVIPSRVRAAK